MTQSSFHLQNSEKIMTKYTKVSILKASNVFMLKKLNKYKGIT